MVRSASAVYSRRGEELCQRQLEAGQYGAAIERVLDAECDALIGARVHSHFVRGRIDYPQYRTFSLREQVICGPFRTPPRGFDLWGYPLDSRTHYILWSEASAEPPRISSPVTGSTVTAC